MALIPTTILTGFLGAGKTTLLNRILQEPHGLKIAVIENEFGPESIDNEILVQDNAEQIIEMNNGCICCTVRGDLVAALGSLAARRDAGELHFDRVIIETTGVANPGPVAQTFFMNDEVAVRYLLDAIITVVDARHAMGQLDTQEEAQRQVGFADRLLLSKTDLVSAADLAVLRARLTRINPRAPIAILDFGRAPIDEVLDLRGFNLNDKLELDPDFLADHDAAPAHDASAHAHAHGAACAPDCTHDHGDVGASAAHAGHHGHAHASEDEISAFMFKSDRPFNVARLDEFLGGIVQVYGPRLLRYKGVLWMDGSDRKIVFQGVHQMMGSDVGAAWAENEPRGSKMVFIGKKLPKETFIEGLEQCLV
ncbi:MAG: GTP-binding protein [Herminiimonas sp.]|nr:GTP-binding protein [Herminiimonas sp.]